MADYPSARPSSPAAAGRFHECGDTTVTETREVTTTTYALDAATGEVTSSEETTTEERTRDLTDEEIAALDCAVVTPPIDEEPEQPTAEQPKPAAPVAKAAATQADADTLAITGGDSMIGWAIAALGMIAAGGAAVAIRRKLA